MLSIKDFKSLKVEVISNEKVFGGATPCNGTYVSDVNTSTNTAYTKSCASGATVDTQKLLDNCCIIP